MKWYYSCMHEMIPCKFGKSHQHFWHLHSFTCIVQVIFRPNLDSLRDSFINASSANSIWNLKINLFTGGKEIALTPMQSQKFWHFAVNNRFWAPSYSSLQNTSNEEVKKGLHKFSKQQAWSVMEFSMSFGSHSRLCFKPHFNKLFVFKQRRCSGEVLVWVQRPEFELRSMFELKVTSSYKE